MNNTEELSDEEKSYHNWVKKNYAYIRDNKNHISVMKKIYIEGFAAGWQYRKEQNSKEWLQK